ncbi:16S rRNA pseudouridine(516) synthase [Enterococcus sp. JM4C]|uniref:16S rRNA pseudouridine(516) synthase n=1 Tax=Candidatus Enterococcus huntleyi TaxID=1857217 RepID=UPI00137A3C81|nr:pseudouridine synthase [Enterococcus sp. JM4C]KAF1299476.1 16S rRNA pseudouridine(516) synthase [Enterococcus sp. JM4C]
MRLDKLIEKELLTSRKEMKRYFARKLVRVDGQVEMNASRNVDSQLHTIQVDTDILRTNHVYLLLNKPVGAVTAVTDGNYPTVTQLVASVDQREFLYPVGRLDRDTEGLLLLTDNGQLGYELLLPDKKVEKTYEVWVNGRLDADDVRAFEEGILFIGGEICKSAKLVILKSSDTMSHCYLTIQEGKFHQVKKMFLARNVKVLRLRRITMGPLQLDEQLPSGAYRPLNHEELLQLKPYFK